jgi:RNA polymerase sigma factor (sigma-70 family)
MAVPLDSMVSWLFDRGSRLTASNAMSPWFVALSCKVHQLVVPDRNLSEVFLLRSRRLRRRINGHIKGCAVSGRSVALDSFSESTQWASTIVSTGTTTDIQRLLDRLQRGEPEARQELLQRAHQRLVRIAGALFQEDFGGLHGRHDLDSVVNETWISLMRALEVTQPETAQGFFGLVFVKVRLALLQIAKRQRRHDVRRLDGPLDADEPEALEAFDCPDTTNDPRRLAILSEFHRQVEKLPDDEKRVFEFHYYLGCTQAETALLMELHPRQVSRLWIEATRRLAEWLKNADGLI